MLGAFHQLPQVLIEVNGEPLPADQARALSSVRVQQKLSMPTLCELTFSQPPGPLETIARWLPGSALRVRVATEAGSALLFNGEITAIEHVYEPAQGRAIHVRGYDLLHRLRKRQSVRAHKQVTLLDLIRERVASLGMEVSSKTRGPVWDQVIQHRQTDFELIAELAERCGLYFYAHDNALHVCTLEGIDAREPIKLSLGDSLLEARVDVNSEAGCKAASASGWDGPRLDVHERTARAPRVGRSVPADAFTSASFEGGSGTRLLVNETLPGDPQADALAQAELDARAMRAIELWGIAEGNPLLEPGARVQVSGLADSLTGRYVLAAVTHVIDGRRGFLSEISTAPPTARPRPIGVAAAPAVVARVDDPERRGRVKVALRTFNDIESDWMCVLMSGAGAGKGLINLPDVGDPVLVLFPQDDPTQGIVLGGVHGTSATALSGGDDGVEGGAVRCYTLVTPGGQRIRLDDVRNTVRVEDRGGSYVELAPDRVMLHAAGKLEIEAPGKSVVIRGKSIDFERA